MSGLSRDIDVYFNLMSRGKSEEHCIDGCTEVNSVFNFLPCVQCCACYRLYSTSAQQLEDLSTQFGFIGPFPPFLLPSSLFKPIRISVLQIS